MAKQTINIGASANDRTGDPLRISFQKINSNFDEVYNNISSLQTEVTDRSWTSNSNTVFNVIDWNSGATITITATESETANAVAYDSRTDSNIIYFVWDADFIDNVWNGDPEGASYEISLDDGTTWIPVETSGYSTNSFYYFSVPFELQGVYSFTYTIGQTAIIRYNRGSNQAVWFDLANDPVEANTITAVDMSLIIEPMLDGDPILTAKILRPNVRFANALYDDDSGAGGISTGANVWSGSSVARGAVNMDIRKTSEPADAGRIYASFDDGKTGTITFYWNAKLYTVT